MAEERESRGIFYSDCPVKVLGYGVPFIRLLSEHFGIFYLFYGF
jgi:hypothetical protein